MSTAITPGYALNAEGTHYYFKGLNINDYITRFFFFANYSAKIANMCKKKSMAMRPHGGAAKALLHIQRSIVPQGLRLKGIFSFRAPKLPFNPSWKKDKQLNLNIHSVWLWHKCSDSIFCLEALEMQESCLPDTIHLMEIREAAKNNVQSPVFLWGWGGGRILMRFSWALSEVWLA